jgi:ketosteroid isomerase-like protein
MTLASDGLEHAVELLDRAFNEGDLEAVLGFYEDAAVVVAEPNRLVRGKSELASFFQSAMQSGLTAKQLRTRVIEADGVALFHSRWLLTASRDITNREPRTFVAATVLRRQPDRSWKALIDNLIGPLFLESA